MPPTAGRILLVPFLVLAGCTSGNDAGPPVKDLLGKWRLVLLDGKAPGENMVAAHEIVFVDARSWTSKTELAGFTMQGGGKWSLANGVVSYGNGTENATSKVHLAKGRLVLDPDFQLRKNDASKAPLVAEYER